VFGLDSLRLWIGAAVLVAALSAGFVVNGWRNDAHKLPAAIAAESKAISDLTDYKVAAAAEARRANAASQGYLDELATLRDRPAGPSTVVRVCGSPDRPHNLPAAPPVPGGPDGSPASPGRILTADRPADPRPVREVELRPELDRLRILAVSADTVSAQLRALQQLDR
jgi:hypothetical protein